MDNKKLIEIALEAREKAYAPYSKFKVGAAVLSENGNVFTGCNVENIAYPLCLCAERNAITTMVASGDMKIKKIAVVADLDNPVAPCGSCRQVISEFANKETEIIMSNIKGNIKIETINTLLPYAFDDF